MFTRLSICILAVATAAAAQGNLSPGLQREAGVDADSGVQYVLLSTSGKLVTNTASPAAESTQPPPQLVAQCKRTPAGKLTFELLSNFNGAASPLAFAAPWKPQPGEMFPPHLVPVTVTMQFLGYTKVKPVRRHWETLLVPSGWLRYATPGTRSRNMEEIMFYMQYLRALPILRLSTGSGSAVEFDTAAWQQAIRSEPLCHASSL